MDRATTPRPGRPGGGRRSPHQPGPRPRWRPRHQRPEPWDGASTHQLPVPQGAQSHQPTGPQGDAQAYRHPGHQPGPRGGSPAHRRPGPQGTQAQAHQHTGRRRARQDQEA